jgi:glutamate-1-semialdehyde aminotransferase
MDTRRTLLARPLFFAEELMPQSPVAISGYEVAAADGRRYIDWYGGSCNLLGYRDARVDAAIRSQLDRPPILPLVNAVELDVAELLVEMIPCAEMVAFGKNGSDGLTGAVRLARMVTGRDVLLHYGYHGFHDWFMAAEPAYSGIPAVLRDLVHRFRYNDIEQVRALLEQFRGRVAAVVMEPVRDELPQPGYLAAVRDLTREAGALLIFDEVVTALRCGNGGAQEFFGVTPDLACLGKCLANGMPLSAIAGPRDLMRDFRRTGVGMTFEREALSLAAARAVLRIAREEPVAERIAMTGETLRTEFDAAAREAGVDAALTGHPARLQVRFADCGSLSGDALAGLFITECLSRGVITSASIMPSYAHDAIAIDKTIEVFRGALQTIAATPGLSFHDQRVSM